ncbi:helix-turn-helix transcriptional regulator [Fulvivirga sediminis]|uniref:Transcriptional regulator n=1 Tax=Fulvivirga sediminis TaxID=2803949 RepID=A0A937F8N2_9BACT|nr:metalloregulator ArsR/SmtB family transcription factor [Fulvivirga sediminis]MBL3658502.1 transcriptional regulator [Fulvivirga sediminis]
MEKYLSLNNYPLNQAQRQILIYLKLNGAQPSTVMAKHLKITNEGTRLHLVKLIEQGLVKSEQPTKGVGRPTSIYDITAQGSALFPDTHADLTTQLLQTIKEELGDEALKKLIAAREKDFSAKYNNAIKENDSLENKLEALVNMRTEEGYMATWDKEDDEYILAENHCPICSAAKECQGFCSAELNNFKKVFGSDVEVERSEHIVKGDRRCAYKIKSKHKVKTD